MELETYYKASAIRNSIGEDNMEIGKLKKMLECAKRMHSSFRITDMFDTLQKDDSAVYGKLLDACKAHLLNLVENEISLYESHIKSLENDFNKLK